MLCFGVQHYTGVKDPEAAEFIARMKLMMKFAEKCGALAVGMDIDHSFDHNGNHDCVLGHDMEPVQSSCFFRGVRRGRGSGI